MYDKLLWQHKRHERGSISKRQTTLKKGLFEGSVPYAWSQTLRIVWCCCTNMASKRKKQTWCLTTHSFAFLTKAVIQQMRNHSYAWSTCVFSLCNARLSLFAMKWSYLNPVRPCRSKRIDQLLHCYTIPRHKTAIFSFLKLFPRSFFIARYIPKRATKWNIVPTWPWKSITNMPHLFRWTESRNRHCSHQSLLTAYLWRCEAIDTSLQKQFSRYVSTHETSLIYIVAYPDIRC